MSVRAKKRNVAVIIPVYNPPTHWAESCLEHIVSLQSLFPKYRFHFSLINDGSENKVFRQINKSLKRAHIQYRVHNFDQNQGKGKALRKGVKRAKDEADFFICVDWDFPFGVLTIGNILEQLEKGSEVVIIDRGKEYLRHIPLLRSVLTQAWRTFIHRVLRLQVGDTQAGTKGFSKVAVQDFLSGEITSFLHDVEFILECQKNKRKITTIPAHLRGGVKLNDFALRTYTRELRMLLTLMKKRNTA